MHPMRFPVQSAAANHAWCKSKSQKLLYNKVMVSEISRVSRVYIFLKSIIIIIIIIICAKIDQSYHK